MTLVLMVLVAAICLTMAIMWTLAFFLHILKFIGFILIKRDVSVPWTQSFIPALFWGAFFFCMMLIKMG